MRASSANTSTTAPPGCSYCLDAIARLNVPRPRERCQPPAREPLAVLVPDGGGAQYGVVMAAPGSEEHRERARRAQQLSDRAREQAGGERAAAERSEHLMVDATGSGLRELPGRPPTCTAKRCTITRRPLSYSSCTPSTSAAPPSERSRWRPRGAAISAQLRIVATASPMSAITTRKFVRRPPTSASPAGGRARTAAGRPRASFRRSDRPLDAAPPRSAGSGQERPGSGRGAAGTE